jgi:thiol-disulfide isomerase/thioredoxin
MRHRLFIILSLFGLGMAVCSQDKTEKQAPARTPATNQVAKETRPPSADEAWMDFVRLARTLPPASSVQTNTGNPAEIERFYESKTKGYLQAADKAKDFFSRFPTDERALQARLEEYAYLVDAFQVGSTSHVARLDGVEKNLLNDSSVPEQIRLQIRVNSLERAAASRRTEGFLAVLDTYEKEAWKLQHEFPQRPEGHSMLMKIAQLWLSNDELDRARAIAARIASSSAPPQVQAQAEMMIKHFGLLGKPLALKFRAVDGREVDLAKLRGKVVLIDFWATWCPACLAEIPNLTATYGRLHEKGFEIVGINLDYAKQNLDFVTRRAGMTWPQHFDGQDQENSLAQQFSVVLLPTMWLVDKQGVLRNLSGGVNLEQKVEKLLAEKPEGTAAPASN